MVKKNTPIPPEQPVKDRSPFLSLAWAILLLAGIFAAKEFVRYNESGEPELSPERLSKLFKELDELDNAEQYALIAANNGYYPCYSCIEKSNIFMHRGEVWKYGVTRKGEKGRYGEWHIDQGLIYVIQLTGALQECLQREKWMIYHYPLMPENRARTIPLIRPPGNKQDN